MGNEHSEFLYDLATHPARAFNRAKELRPWIYLVAVVVLSGVSLATGATLLISRFTGAGRITLFYNLIFITIIFTSIWIVDAGILHFFAEVFGKKGRVVDLFVSLGLASFPFIFITPIVLMVEGLFRARIFFHSIFIVGLLVWYFFLLLAGIKEVYSSSSFEAFLILLTPILLFTVVSIFIPLGFILLTVLSLSL